MAARHSSGAKRQQGWVARAVDVLLALFHKKGTVVGERRKRRQVHISATKGWPY